jgi:hypothetical protein
MVVTELAFLKKSYRDALERVWTAEIEGRLPLQSKATVFKQLEADGLVTFGKERLGADRFGAIEVEGWYLTHAGRFAYCMSCN